MRYEGESDRGIRDSEGYRPENEKSENMRSNERDAGASLKSE